MAAGKKYLRCGCPACGNVITYPDYSAGGTSACEKCGKSVRLPAAPAPSAAATSPVAPPPPRPPLRPVNPPPKRRGFLRFVLWTLNLAVITGVVIVVLPRQKHPDAAASDDQPISTNTPATAPATQPVTSPTATPPPAPTAPSTTNVVTITNVVTVTNNPAATTNMPASVTNPPAPLSATNSATAIAGTNSLAVLGLAIERPRGNKGSQLTYVTGVLQNQSDQKRFGVRIDLNLLDRSRNNVGTATDYAPVIDPRATWRFRALVLDARAVGASVAGIREDR